MSNGFTQLTATRITAEQYTDFSNKRSHGVCLAIIEPDVAKYILENHNDNNRPVRKAQKDFLKKQLRSGDFQYNGESIVVGHDGCLLDGQHRMMACCETRIPFAALLVFGVQPDCFVTFDQGAKRSGADVLAIDGHSNATALSATLRQISMYDQGRIGRDAGRLVENLEAKRLYGIYPDVKYSVTKAAGIVLTSATLAAALHYIFKRIDEVGADEFISVIKNGVKPGKNYSPIGESAALLLQWLTRQIAGPKRLPKHYTAYAWIKAWNAGRRGVLPRVLSYKESEGHIEAI